MHCRKLHPETVREKICLCLDHYDHYEICPPSVFFVRWPFRWQCVSCFCSQFRRKINLDLNGFWYVTSNRKLWVGSRPVTSLGHEEGRRFFCEGPKFFKLCPIILNIQHIFPEGAKTCYGGVDPLVTGLLWSDRNLSEDPKICNCLLSS